MKSTFTMNIKISHLALAGLALLTSACSDWLDLRPEGEIILDEYWQTEMDATQVLAACYKGMCDNGYMERIFVWGECRSDNVTEGSSVGNELKKVLNQEIEPNNGMTTWNNFYTVINYCNTFLKYAPDAQEADNNFTEDNLHAMEAEAVAIRALTYFYLVRTFGDVPWITTPSIDDEQNYLVPKTDQQLILDSLVIDLENARRFARTRHKNNEYTKGRFTKAGINALLADIELWRGNYAGCIDACDRVISDSYYELVLPEQVLTRVFYTGNSTESIFELQFDDIKQFNNMTANFFGNRSNPSGRINYPANLVITQYSPFNYAVGGGYIESKEDYRFKDFIVNKTGVSTYKVFKYAGMSRKEDASGSSSTYDYRSNTSNWIVYRLSDVLLMKAEAVTQLYAEAGIQEALNLVNQTYLRSNPDADSLKSEYYNGINDIESLVLRERQRELMFEGKRYFDLLRLARRKGNTSDVTSFVSRTSTSTELYGNMSTIDALYWPINEEELIDNPLLEQNPFYENTYPSASK